MAKGKNEVSTNTTGAGEIVAFDASKYKIGQRVVVPTISLAKMKEGDAFYFRAETEVKQKQAMDEKTGEAKVDDDGKPVMLHVLQVTNLETGEYGEIVAGIIAAHGLQECAPITGRLFAMQKGVETKGKATKWSVVEMIEG